MSQEDIKEVVLKHTKERFDAEKLSEYIDTGVNNIRVNLVKLIKDIENGFDKDLHCAREKNPVTGHVKIFVWSKKFRVKRERAK